MSNIEHPIVIMTDVMEGKYSAEAAAGVTARLNESFDKYNECIDKVESVLLCASRFKDSPEDLKKCDFDGALESVKWLDNSSEKCENQECAEEMREMLKGAIDPREYDRIAHNLSQDIRNHPEFVDRILRDEVSLDGAKIVHQKLVQMKKGLEEPSTPPAQVLLTYRIGRIYDAYARGFLLLAEEKCYKSIALLLRIAREIRAEIEENEREIEVADRIRGEE